ncbi:MAG: hypothetical protein R3F30_10255 [Planctomycetota bacterium]
MHPPTPTAAVPPRSWIAAALCALCLWAPRALRAQGDEDPRPAPAAGQAEADKPIPFERILELIGEDAFLTIRSKAADGLPLTADFYPGRSKDAPILLLFHQAGASRGEYRRTAPLFQKRGYTCLALDARAGDGIGWGVANVTRAHATERKQPVGYEDARQDLERCLPWVREIGLTGPIVLVGSSYSASLVLLMATPESDGKRVAGVVAFSPGEYLKPKGKVLEAVKRVEVPVFMTCSRNEVLDTAGPMARNLKHAKSQFFLPKVGEHGSRFLWLVDAKDADSAEDARELWKRLWAFLGEVAPVPAPASRPAGTEAGEAAGSRPATREAGGGED